MEFLPGGDMMSHLIRLDIFSDYQTKFYIAELIEAVHSVHKLGLATSSGIIIIGSSCHSHEVHSP